jgi:hypothetical protein
MKKIDKEEFLKRLRDPEKEYCIICGEETPYKKSDHILMRKYYEEGVGQLCKRCYFLIYFGEKIKKEGDKDETTDY